MNGAYGSVTLQTNGQWTYTASTAHNEFVGGTTYTDVFTVSSADGTTSTITVNILGTNDAAVLSTATVNLTGNERRSDRKRHTDHFGRRQRRHLRGFKHYRRHLRQPGHQRG
ncbi:VCBS domain-containing protein [Massilia sp. H-1]|nr:VCBS domain-containing protein [Massilia sp. H-1]